MSSPIFLADTRVYIAGVLMPTIQVTITSSVDQPPVANIAMPADHRLFSIGKGDKIPVHIFQRDVYSGSNEFLLLFEGVIVSRSYSNTYQQRSIAFSCVGLLDILNDVKVTFLHTYSDMYRAAVPGFDEITLGIKDMIGFPLCFLLKGLNCLQNGGVDATIRYPFQYLQNVYQYIAGPEAAIDMETGEPLEEEKITKLEHNSKLSEFFARYAKIIKLMNRFAKVPFFDENKKDANGNDTVWDENEGGCIFPLLRAMQVKKATAFIGKQLQTQQPDIQSARNLLDIVAQPMEFEFANFSAPAFYSGDKNASSYYDKTPRLVSSCLKPVFSESIPPMCNVIFRSQVLGIESRDVFKDTATRVQVLDANSPEAYLGNINPEDKQALLEIAMTRFYPLRGIEESDLLDPSLQVFATTLLDSEEYTGPVVRQVGTPAWWNWADSLGSSSQNQNTQGGSTAQGGQAVQASDEQTITKDIIARQRMCHRQLLLARYMNYKISVTTTFNPYITPGFPGVVFDALDTGMSFAGYILAVNHTISPDSSGMATNIEMNYVRPLFEAASVEIVHPVEELQDFIHDEAAMTEIYNALLGTPQADKEKEDKKKPQEDKKAQAEATKNPSASTQANAGSGTNAGTNQGTNTNTNPKADPGASNTAGSSPNPSKNATTGSTKNEPNGSQKNTNKKSSGGGGATMPGAEAKSFANIQNLYGSVADGSGNPQNDPSEAYAAQRRNICTFSQYLGFMGLAAEMGQGPGGEEIPIGFSKDKSASKKEESKKEEPKKEEPKTATASNTAQKKAGGTPEKPAATQQPASNAGKQEPQKQEGQNAGKGDEGKSDEDKEDFIGYHSPVYLYSRMVEQVEKNKGDTKTSNASSNANKSSKAEKAAAAATAGEGKGAPGSKAAPATNTADPQKAAASTNAAQAQGGAGTGTGAGTAQTTKPEGAAGEQKADDKKNLVNPKRETHTEKVTLVREQVDLRTLLRAVSQEAFSKHVYA